MPGPLPAQAQVIFAGQRLYVNLLRVGMGRGPGNKARVVYTLQLYIHMWCIGSGFSLQLTLPYIHIFMYVFVLTGTHCTLCFAQFVACAQIIS